MTVTVKFGERTHIEGERVRGDDWALLFQLVDANDAPLGDITGWSAKWTGHTVKHPTDISTQLFQVNATIHDAANAIFRFKPTTVQMDHIGKVFIDIEVTDASGVIVTPADGFVRFIQDKTK